MRTLFDDATTVAVTPTLSVVNAQAQPLVPVAIPTRTTALVTVTDDQIDSLGDKYATQLSSASTKMLSSVRASDADAFGVTLNQLVATAKGMDPSGYKKGGILSRVTHLFGSVKDKMLAQYDTVEKRMDALISELDKSAAKQAARIHDFEDMFTANRASHEGLEQAIAQGQQLVTALNSQLELQKSVANPDAFTAQQVADTANRIHRLEKKVDDLTRATLLAKQAAPEIRLLQENARTLVDKFSNTKKVTIPAWKQAFTLYLMQLEQKAGAALATTIDDATNAAFNMQADLLRQNTTEIAKAKERSLVDLSTLEHVQEQLLGSFDDMQKIQDEGRQARKDAEPKLKALEQQLIDRFTKAKA